MVALVRPAPLGAGLQGTRKRRVELRSEGDGHVFDALETWANKAGDIIIEQREAFFMMTAAQAADLGKHLLALASENGVEVYP